MTTAVIVVDMLRGFMEEGHPLYCGDAARAIIPYVQKLLTEERKKGSAIFFIADPFRGLVLSQMLLSVQLPLTILLQLALTSSRKVMGPYANTAWHTFVLACIAAAVIGLNLKLLWDSV
jgi:hypothetical protein